MTGTFLCSLFSLERTNSLLSCPAQHQRVPHKGSYHYRVTHIEIPSRVSLGSASSAREAKFHAPNAASSRSQTKVAPDFPSPSDQTQDGMPRESILPAIHGMAERDQEKYEQITCCKTAICHRRI